MKRCPNCNRTFTDVSLNFCLEDGTPLVDDSPVDPGATLRYTDLRPTSPPATEIYPPPAASRPSEARRPHQQFGMADPVKSRQSVQWAPVPPMPPPKKSNAVWWILGGLVVAGVVVVGVAMMVLVLASMGANSNNNSNTNTRNSNLRANRNANTPGNANVNTNASVPATTTDDFSAETWDTGTSSYGDTSYVDGEYRMRSKERTYLVMYAPSQDFSTENATLSVKAHSVDGSSVTTGYGLIIHGQKTGNGKLNDYALLIFNGAEPKYSVVKHKAGVQTVVVPWTASSAVLGGENANQLEIRAQGSEVSFYVNGEYLNRLTDNEMRKGVAGLYTSGTNEVAFDNLEIRR